MRLDHLLSMETGTGCHDSVIRVDEVGTQKAECGSFVVQFSGTGKWSLKRKEPVVWGCSSVGRAPALQAGGHGFESHHLHQSAVPTPATRGRSKETLKFIPDGEESLNSKQGKRQTRVRKMGRINTE